MGKYYLDTCIWRDFLEERTGKKPIGIYASALIRKIMRQKETICYLSIVFKELEGGFSQEDIARIFGFLSQTGFAQYIRYTDQQFQEAIALAKTASVPKHDALHAIIARDAHALLVTRDHHFLRLKHIVKAMYPEDL